MLVSNNWQDYELLDASCGEKLERFGKYILLRPDPSIIWDNGCLKEKYKDNSFSASVSWEKIPFLEIDVFR